MPPSPNDRLHGPSETPHYHGHRERLRDRFRAAGAEALSDYELMELVLFRALPRRDVKPLAKSLIQAFGSFAETIHAPDAHGLGYRQTLVVSFTEWPPPGAMLRPSVTVRSGGDGRSCRRIPLSRISNASQ